jgi:hypothetical protein
VVIDWEEGLESVVQNAPANRRPERLENEEERPTQRSLGNGRGETD